MSTVNAEHFIFDTKLKADRDYWIQRLSGERGESDLRLDYARTAAEAGPKETVRISITRIAYEKLVALTGDVDLPAYAFLLAALKVCLHKYTGSDVIVVGSPCIRKAHGGPGTPNALAILDDIDSRMTFRAFLLQVQEGLKAAYARQDYPLDRLVKDLGIEPGANRCPLFSVALGLNNIHAGMPEVGNDVTITFEKSPNGATGEIMYRSNLFNRSAIERFARHFMMVAGAALDNIDGDIGDLKLLADAERQELLFEWNDTGVEYLGERCLHRMFERQAAKTPDAIALNSEQEQVTYRELNYRANQLGRYLQAEGVGPEVIVGVCAERSVEMIVGILGALKAGGAYMPMDPAYPQARLRLMMQDTQAPVLLTQERLLGTLPEVASRKVCLDTEWHLISKQSGADAAGGPASDNLAYVIYTSGSTGQPKGVLVAHWAASCLVEAQVKAFELNARDRVFQFASLSFDASVSEIFTTLAAGATLELGNPEALYVGSFLNHELKTKSITTITLPPSIMADTVAEGIPALRAIVAAGESCAAATAGRWAQGRLFINAYGPSEAAVCASLTKGAPASNEPPPIGRPIENKRIYLLDRLLEPVAIGVKGEVFIGGPGLARGYLNRPEVTAERFIPDPFEAQAGGRLYRTGDLACYLCDGNITFLGRADYQVKIRGHRIELGEIEHLLSQHPAIQEAVVARDKKDERLIAYVAPAEGAQVVVSELRNHLKELVPGYMVPAIFVSLPALPLTRNGKVDRQNLPEVDPRRAELADGYVAPRNELESELAGIFGDVLGVEEVGIYDNFFELGGHSLMAVQLITRIRDAFRVDLDVIAAFEAPTVAELAVTIVQTQMEQLDSESMSEMLTEIDRVS